MLRDYYTLTKPGIMYGNALTVVTGFVLASYGGVDWRLLAVTTIGLSLVVASGCVFNNIIDRDIDALMERTKSRPLVRGVIKKDHAFLFGTMLLILGIVVLMVATNWLAVVAALVGFFVYVVVYSLWLKRNSVHSTLIGGISGAIPPLVGYVAVNGTIDIVAVLLFVVMVVWQVPHSFAIALYRLSDYEKANIAVFPVKCGIYATKVRMSIYVLLFMVSTYYLAKYSYLGTYYIYTMVALSVMWFVTSVHFLHQKSLERKIARKFFFYSILILFVWCCMIIFDRLLHT